MRQILGSLWDGSLIQEGNVYMLEYDELVEHDGKKYHRFSRTHYLDHTNGDHFVRSASISGIGFSVDHIERIDPTEFLKQFLWLEVLSLQLMCIREANDVEQHFRLQSVFDKLSLAARLEIIKKYYVSDQSDKTAINKLQNDILPLRNQIAHAVNPEFVRVNNKFFPDDNVDMLQQVKMTLWNGVTVLVEEYKQYQGKLDDWAELISQSDGADNE